MKYNNWHRLYWTLFIIISKLNNKINDISTLFMCFKVCLHVRADLKGKSKMLLFDIATPHKSKDTKEKYLDLKLSIIFFAS